MNYNSFDQNLHLEKQEFKQQREAAPLGCLCDRCGNYDNCTLINAEEGLIYACYDCYTEAQGETW